MKNWRTTLTGLVLSIPFAIQAILEALVAGYFTDKTGMQLFGAIGVIVLSALMKDFNVSGGVRSEADDELVGTRPGGR